MHEPTKLPPPIDWTKRLAPLGGIAALLGLTLLFSVYLWSAREPTTVQPVDVVTVRPPMRDSSSAVEVVPFQYALDTHASPCPIPSAALCLVIGVEASPPASITTFT